MIQSFNCSLWDQVSAMDRCLAKKIMKDLYGETRNLNRVGLDVPHETSTITTHYELGQLVRDAS